MNAPGWEHFDHEADIGIRGFGRDPAEAFEQAALALTAVLTDPAGVKQETEVALQAENADRELLLIDWLSALLLEMAARHMLFSRFAITLAGDRLAARAWGEKVDPARHQPAAEVKGASYGGLRLFRRPDGLWQAECIVDV
jgi:SHS2 domain-containing protein